MRRLEEEAFTLLLPTLLLPVAKAALVREDALSRGAAAAAAVGGDPLVEQRFKLFGIFWRRSLGVLTLLAAVSVDFRRCIADL